MPPLPTTKSGRARCHARWQPAHPIPRGQRPTLPSRPVSRPGVRCRRWVSGQFAMASSTGRRTRVDLSGTIVVAVEELRHRNLDARRRRGEQHPAATARSCGAHASRRRPILAPVAARFVPSSSSFAQEWPRIDAGSGPHERGARAIEEPLPLRFRLQETKHDGPEIRIVQRVDHDWLAIPRVTQPLSDPRWSSAADLFQRERGDVRRLDPVMRLLLDPVGQRAGAVAEGRVAGELGLAAGTNRSPSRTKWTSPAVTLPPSKNAGQMSRPSIPPSASASASVSAGK